MDLATILESLPNPISFLKEALDFQQGLPPKELPKKEEGKKITLREHFNSETERNNLPPGLLYAVSGTEVGTTRDPLSAKSNKNAVGMFQHTPIFQKEYKISMEESTDPVRAATRTAEVLASLNKRFDGDWNKTVAAYNAGPTAIKKLGLENAPKETRDYVRNIASLLAGETPLRQPNKIFERLLDTELNNIRKQENK